MRRRVPHILGLYLGGAWIVVEFVSFLTERYLLSDTVTDLVLVGLLAMLPAVAVVAWFHGTPGKDEWVTAEKVFVPLNALVTVALLAFMFRGEELGATTTTLTATDERGATVSRVAPRARFRQTLAVFPFANETGDEALDWMQYGVAHVLQRDLEQNAYIDAWSPLDGFEQSGLLDLQRAGFDRALNVPVSLMRRVASDQERRRLVAGTIAREGDIYRLEATLHDSAGSAAPRQFSAADRDLGRAIDGLSAAIRAALELPSGADALGADLPVADHFTAVPAAMQLHAEALVASALENDTPRAIELLSEAAQADPSFAPAHLRRAVHATRIGQAEEARSAVSQATQHEYRLLPEEKFVLKAMQYYVHDKIPEMLSVYETRAELYPESIDALITLAFSYLFMANDIDKALATFQRIRANDPGATWVLNQIGRLHIVRGEVDAARAVLHEHVQARTDDYRPLLSLAQLEIEAGNLAAAREHLERAVVVSVGRVTPLVALAELEMREGHYEAAAARLDEADSLASVPRQHSAVIRGRIDYLARQGLFVQLGEQLDRLYENDRQFRGPINLMMTSVVDYAEFYVLAGAQDRFFDRLEFLKAQLGPPIDGLANVGYLGLHLTTGDADEAERYAMRAGALIEQFGREDLEYLTHLAVARIRELRGDLPGAVQAAEASLAQFTDSVHSIDTEADQIRIRNILGDYRARAGDLGGAIDVLNQVIKTYPAHPLANLLLAEIALRRGDRDAARQHLAVSLDAWARADDDYALAQRARALAVQLDGA